MSCLSDTLGCDLGPKVSRWLHHCGFAGLSPYHSSHWLESSACGSSWLELHSGGVAGLRWWGQLHPLNSPRQEALCLGLHPKTVGGSILWKLCRGSYTPMACAFCELAEMASFRHCQGLLWSLQLMSHKDPLEPHLGEPGAAKQHCRGMWGVELRNCSALKALSLSVWVGKGSPNHPWNTFGLILPLCWSLASV